MKTQVVVISGDGKMDHMMHAFDVFESFKRYALIQTYEVEGIDTAPSVITSAMKSAAEKIGHGVVAVFIPGVAEGAYLDTTVKVISDGSKWGMLRDVLVAYGYAGEDQPA